MGIYIKNGFVEPEEPVAIEITLPVDTPRDNLPKALDIYPQYLETAEFRCDFLPLHWSKENNVWKASVEHTPSATGNYSARVKYEGKTYSAYFAVWKPGISVVTFWVMITPVWHAGSNLKDLYIPDIAPYYLPFDYELTLVGDAVFCDNWEPHQRLKLAQEQLSADIIPFFDGGYFHRLDPTLEERFKFDECGRLPDPTFHDISVEHCQNIINGARRYWKRWGYRDFTGIANYSPTNELVEACRRTGITWISGVFPDADITDGKWNWNPGWTIRHAGMPDFPYFVSPDDFRRAARADDNGTMIFLGDRRNPVLNHGGYYSHGTDTVNGIRNFGVERAVDKVLEAGELFFRNNSGTKHEFPFVVSFPIQFSSCDYGSDGQTEANKKLICALAQRARAGNLVFAHKRHLQSFFRRHFGTSPELACYIPDLMAGANPEAVKNLHFVSGKHMASAAEKPILDHDLFDENFVKPDPFPDTLWCEGPDGKAAFIAHSLEGVTVDHEGSPYLPFWWYDYGTSQKLTQRDRPEREDLKGFKLAIDEKKNGLALIITAPRNVNGLPVALWKLSESVNPEKIAPLRPLRVVSPVDSKPYIIIRPDVTKGENRIVLK